MKWTSRTFPLPMTGVNRANVPPLKTRVHAALAGLSPPSRLSSPPGRLRATVWLSCLSRSSLTAQARLVTPAATVVGTSGHTTGSRKTRP